VQSRRLFLNSAAATAIVPKSVVGANRRVQMAVIGTGNRGTRVHRAFKRHRYVAFGAARDLAASRMDTFVSQAGAKPATYNDYRRVL
jgi:predicted dehydrogenase